MASKTTNKTIWTLALILVIGFLVWKLWPAIKNFLNRLAGGSGSGTGSTGGGVSYYPPNYGQSGAQPSAGIGLNPFTSGSSPAYGGQPSLNEYLAVTGALDQSGLPGTTGYYGDVSQQGYDAINNDLIPYQPLNTSGLTDFSTNPLTGITDLIFGPSNWFSPSSTAPIGSLGATSEDTSLLGQTADVQSDYMENLTIGGSDEGDLSAYNSFPDLASGAGDGGPDDGADFGDDGSGESGGDGLDNTDYGD